MLHTCLILRRDLQFPPETINLLTTFGLKPYVVASLRSATRLLGQWTFDAAVVDSTGGDMDIRPALEALEGAGVPTLLLTPPLDEAAQVSALEWGASDVLPTPVSLKLVATKLCKLIRLHTAQAPQATEKLSVGCLHLDPRENRARVGQQVLDLTPRQFELVLLLAMQAGKFVHRQTIARTLRISGDEGSRSLDMQVSRVRRKLRDTGDRRISLDSVYGRGYCLSIAEEAAQVQVEASAALWCA